MRNNRLNTPDGVTFLYVLNEKQEECLNAFGQWRDRSLSKKIIRGDVPEKLISIYEDLANFYGSGNFPYSEWHLDPTIPDLRAIKLYTFCSLEHHKEKSGGNYWTTLCNLASLMVHRSLDFGDLDFGSGKLQAVDGHESDEHRKLQLKL